MYCVLFRRPVMKADNLGLEAAEASVLREAADRMTGFR